MQEQVGLALSGLSERQREIVRLHFAEGLGYAEIALRTGWTQRAVKRQLIRSYAEKLLVTLDSELVGVLQHGRP